MATLMTASHQWSTRPNDERIAGDEDRGIGPITEFVSIAESRKAHSTEKVFANRELHVHPVKGDDQALVVVGPAGNPFLPTNWAFGQLAQRAGVPASYLRDQLANNTPLAADCLNWGLENRSVESIGILTRNNGQGPTLASATGPDYGRIWHAEVGRAILKQFGDGLNGDFRVPGEFGKRVKITKANTTVYLSDRDCFIFLADENRRIDVPNRRDGKSGSMARGFFMGNSEEGSSTLFIDTFMFDHVCCNRIVWGATDVQRVRIRHTKGAPFRFIEEVRPALEAYAESSTQSMLNVIANAKNKKIGTPEKVQEFLSKRFTRTQAQAFDLTHQQEEGRPIETIWDAVTGASAYAKRIEHQDVRIDLERKAGAMLDLAA